MRRLLGDGAAAAAAAVDADAVLLCVVFVVILCVLLWFSLPINISSIFSDSSHLLFYFFRFIYRLNRPPLSCLIVRRPCVVLSCRPRWLTKYKNCKIYFSFLENSCKRKNFLCAIFFRLQLHVETRKSFNFQLVLLLLFVLKWFSFCFSSSSFL